MLPIDDKVLSEHQSSFAFDQTVDRLSEAIIKAGMQLFAVIDHAANARAAGLEMPPVHSPHLWEGRGRYDDHAGISGKCSGSALACAGTTGCRWSNHHGLPSGRADAGDLWDSRVGGGAAQAGARPALQSDYPVITVADPACSISPASSSAMVRRIRGWVALLPQ